MSKQRHQYRTCPYCGANLDPGERCDCREGEMTAVNFVKADKGRSKFMEPIETMTVEEATENLRARGVKTSPNKIRNGLKQGVYPFGDVVMMDKAPSFTIYKRLFDMWVAERI